MNKCDYPEMVRSIRTIPLNRRHVTGFVSWRGESSIPYESPLERDFVLRQEFSLGVASVVSQPCRIAYTDSDGREHHYTPDYLVIYTVRDEPAGKERLGDLHRLLIECAKQAIESGEERITKRIVEAKSWVRPTRGIRELAP